MAILSYDIFGEAKSAARSGDRAKARHLLARLLLTDLNNADYWVWMSAVADSSRRRRYCLKRALKINPTYSAAIHGLTTLGVGSNDDGESTSKGSIPRQEKTPFRLHSKVNKATKLNYNFLGISVYSLMAIILAGALGLLLLPSSWLAMAQTLPQKVLSEFIVQDNTNAMGVPSEERIQRFSAFNEIEPIPQSPPKFTTSTSYPDLESSDLFAILQEDHNLASAFSSAAYQSLPDFDASWAQINYYDWKPTGYTPTDFIIRADVSLESATDKANWWNSGCGFVFRMNARGDHYLAFISLDGWFNFYRNLDYTITRIGRWKFGVLENNKTNTKIMLVAEGDWFTFYVNDDEIHRQQEKTLKSGLLGYAIISGTNKGFGTHCKITNVELLESSTP